MITDAWSFTSTPLNLFMEWCLGIWTTLKWQMQTLSKCFRNAIFSNWWEGEGWYVLNIHTKCVHLGGWVDEWMTGQMG